MPTYTEKLPARKSSKNSTIYWTPSEDNAFSPVAGDLRIATDRDCGGFRVEEFPSEHSRTRGFMFIKTDAGTDETETQYAVFCRPELPEMTSCGCKGFGRFFTCKHADAANAIVQNGWI